MLAAVLLGLTAGALAALAQSPGPLESALTRSATPTTAPVGPSPFPGNPTNQPGPATPLTYGQQLAELWLWASNLDAELVRIAGGPKPCGPTGPCLWDDSPAALTRLALRSCDMGLAARVTNLFPNAEPEAAALETSLTHVCQQLTQDVSRAGLADPLAPFWRQEGGSLERQLGPAVSGAQKLLPQNQPGISLSPDSHTP